MVALSYRTDGDQVRGQYVGAFLEVARMASHIDDGSAYGYHSVLTAGIYGQHVGGFLEVADGIRQR